MKIAVLLDNPFINDRRVYREVTALAAAGYSLTVFCVKSSGLPGEEDRGSYKVRRIFDADIFEVRNLTARRKYTRILCEFQPDVLHCHDQWMLHQGRRVKDVLPSVVLIYDSHELFHAWPLNVSKAGDPWLFLKSWLVRKMLVVREKKNLRSIDHLVTVNESLARDLKLYGKLKNKPLVVRNIPELYNPDKDASLLRSHFHLPAHTTILVFIGSAVYRKTLNLEQVIAETASFGDLALVIICGEQGGKRDLMDWTAAKGYRHVFFHPKLKPEDIGPVLASCDVGLVPTWNRKDLSYWYALDNKLFEYMMSDLPVLATQQPEYRSIVEKYHIGECVDPDQPGAYAAGLRKILDDPETYRKSIRKAKIVLNWEQEKYSLLEFYEKIAIP